MATRGLLLVVVVSFGAALTGCSSTPTPVSTPRPIPASQGQALYEKYCAVCHGYDGVPVEGTNTPELRRQSLLAVVDDAFLYENTARGRPGENGRGRPGTKMSAFGQEYGGPLTRSEIEAIVSYIRHWQTEPLVSLAPYASNGDPDAGRLIYQAQCASCHGTDGWSATAPSLAGITFQETASDALIRHAILHGRPPAMPMFRLKATEVADVIAYVRTLGAPLPPPAASPSPEVSGGAD